MAPARSARAVIGAFRPRGRTIPCEAPAIFLAADDAGHPLAEALDRLRAGLTIGPGNTLALGLRQLPLELDALLCQFQQPLAAVASAVLLDDESLPYQLL